MQRDREKGKAREEMTKDKIGSSESEEERSAETAFVAFGSRAVRRPPRDRESHVKI